MVRTGRRLDSPKLDTYELSYDFLVHSAERGHLWQEAIRAYKAGERGIPATEVIRALADEFGLDL